MPIYIYECSLCHNHVELTHSIAECNNPSEEIQRRTCCNRDTCINPMSRGIIPEFGHKWHRVPQLTNLDSYSLMTPQQKQIKLAKRSRDHNKKEGSDEQNYEHTKAIQKDFKS